MRLGQGVIEAVHQEDRPVVTRPDERSCHLGEPAGGDLPVEGQTRRREVALGEMVRQHRAAVRGHPPVRRGQEVDLLASSPPVDEGPEPEAAKELRELRGMAERVRAVRDA